MASCLPVDAPDGVAARPDAPPASVASTSTVGFPRESSISRAWIDRILVSTSVILDGTGGREGIERKKGVDGTGLARAVAAACAVSVFPACDEPDYRISRDTGADFASITAATVLPEERRKDRT